MQTHAVIFEEPGKLTVDQVNLAAPGADDLVVESIWSGISTGTERLLWSGDMPMFPGMGYPLVPGYETVGTVVDAPKAHRNRIGERVYVPGCAAYTDVRGLFGGTAATLIAKADKAYAVDEEWRSDAVLMALAATAHHALAGSETLPNLIVGHGVLGRIMARMAVALGAENLTVWETNADRAGDAAGYRVVDPATDGEGKYATIIDVSGDAKILDTLIQRLAPGGEIVLAGFYSSRIDFAFPPAFMKEARLRVAAEWKPEDMAAVLALLREGKLSLGGLVTHTQEIGDAAQAYETAFGDPACLKMVLNWSDAS